MVYFVGAGSGAPDLITLRGARLLEQVPVVIYAGSLVNPQLLERTKVGCRIYNSAEMTLEEVIQVMQAAHGAGEDVVRLHTGDPSLYGAVREQMDRLDERGIPWEVCPGVSSFCGAAAALGMEYTLPGVSQTVILTRLAGRTPVPERESVEALAAHGATMVVFLSAGRLGELTRRLLAGGYRPDTPAAIVYRATWPDEKVIRCTVAELERRAAEEGISRTALVVAGDAAAQAGYQRSQLYHPAFTTGFRKGEEQ